MRPYLVTYVTPRGVVETKHIRASSADSAAGMCAGSIPGARVLCASLHWAEGRP